MLVITAICKIAVFSNVVFRNERRIDHNSCINIEIITFQLTKRSFVAVLLFYSVFDIECYHLFHSDISVHFDAHNIPTIRYNKQFYPIYLELFQSL